MYLLPVLLTRTRTTSVSFSPSIIKYICCTHFCLFFSYTVYYTAGIKKSFFSRMTRKKRNSLQRSVESAILVLVLNDALAYLYKMVRKPIGQTIQNFTNDIQFKPSPLLGSPLTPSLICCSNWLSRDHPVYNDRKKTKKAEE